MIVTEIKKFDRCDVSDSAAVCRQARASVAQIKRALLKVGLAYEKVIGNELIGVHPANRRGLGIDRDQVFSMMGTIIGVGFDPEETRGSMCFERVPGDTAAYEFNVEKISGARLGRRSLWLCASCLAVCSFSSGPAQPTQQTSAKQDKHHQSNRHPKHGYLALPSSSRLQYLSIAGTHTAFMLNCIQQQTFGEMKAILDQDGRVSKGMVYKMSESFRDPVENGFKW